MRIYVNDKMQQDYIYERVEKPGENFDDNFKPEISPKEMLNIGVFGGKYITDCQDEFPSDWFENAKLSPNFYDESINFFGVRASQPLAVWREKGWIHEEDPRGWFQWYCRYFMGRRHIDDKRQIKRWRAYRRHLTQLEKNCKPFDFDCRPKQRQSLLHWAYDSRLV